MYKALLLAGALSALFGAWGTYTPAGRREFDEMAGMIPMAALYLGGLLIAAGAALWLKRR